MPRCSAFVEYSPEKMLKWFVAQPLSIESAYGLSMLVSHEGFHTPGHRIQTEPEIPNSLKACSQALLKLKVVAAKELFKDSLKRFGFDRVSGLSAHYANSSKELQFKNKWGI